MVILVDVGMPDWMEDSSIKQKLQLQLPNTDIFCAGQGVQDIAIEMVIVADWRDEILEIAPNLKLIQKLGAGVDTIMASLAIPQNVRVARLVTDSQAQEMARYCLTHVLDDLIGLSEYRSNSLGKIWRTQAPRRPEDTNIAILGIGHIGRAAAKLFNSLNFRVSGWSKTSKELTNINCLIGEDGLKRALQNADVIILALPSTELTKKLINMEVFLQMKPNAMLINVGRGDTVDEIDLQNALDKEFLRRAVLDVFCTEPLPENHPFWTHPAVTITPHISGWHVEGWAEVAAHNYKCLKSGKPMLHEVSRAAEY